MRRHLHLRACRPYSYAEYRLVGCELEGASRRVVAKLDESKSSAGLAGYCTSLVAQDDQLDWPRMKGLAG